MFFRILSGTVEQPETIVIEVIDFFLMDIGSTGFTNTHYSESGASLMEFQMENPHTMDDGIRMGYCHSHHSMRTFYSGEDVDDMVVNTADKDVDYYVTMIINNDGDFIARIAFRIKETIEQKIERRFFSTMLSKSNWKADDKKVFEEPVLVMVPLTVEQEGFDVSSISRMSALKTEKAAKFEKEREIANKNAPPVNYEARSFNGRTYHDHQKGKDHYGIGKEIDFRDEKYRNNNGRGGQGHLWDGFEQNDQLAPDEKEELLFGKLMDASMTSKRGLDAAVKAFNREFAALDGTPYIPMIHLHAEAILNMASSIIELNEGSRISTNYIFEVMSDFTTVLINDYVDYTPGTEETLPENRAVEELVDRLENMMMQVDEGKFAEHETSRSYKVN